MKKSEVKEIINIIIGKDCSGRPTYDLTIDVNRSAIEWIESEGDKLGQLTKWKNTNKAGDARYTLNVARNLKLYEVVKQLELPLGADHVLCWDVVVQFEPPPEPKKAIGIDF